MVIDRAVFRCASSIIPIGRQERSMDVRRRDLNDKDEMRS